MGTIAHAAVTRRHTSEDPLGDLVLRSERSMALIRVLVTAAVMTIYFSSLGIRRSLGPGAIVVLSLAAVYSIASLLLVAENVRPSYAARVATLLIDVLLVTLWVQSTGGRHSEFWTLYLVVMVSAALRFRLFETLGVAVGVTVLHLAVTMVDARSLSRAEVIFRPVAMIATGFAVSMLAYQRSVQRRDRATLEELADRRALELGHHRAEVERLRSVDIKRSEFVAVAAHEFRSPLAAIVGVLSTLKVHGEVLDREVREELIEGAASQAERLSRLVEDLLTASRLEDGILRLAVEPVEPRDLVADATQASGTLGRVHVELGRTGPVSCDPDAAVRVLTNLLDNARKYSPDGARIVVSVEAVGDRVRFAVRDAGPGVPVEDRDAIFERFRRWGDGSAPGAGLGLYICRGLVEVHGGELRVGDAPEGGAEFSFDLAAAHEHPSVTEVTPAPAPVR